jgi:hypothetical protein
MCRSELRAPIFCEAPSKRGIWKTIQPCRHPRAQRTRRLVRNRLRHLRKHTIERNREVALWAPGRTIPVRAAGRRRKHSPARRARPQRHATTDDLRKEAGWPGMRVPLPSTYFAPATHHLAPAERRARCISNECGNRYSRASRNSNFTPALERRPQPFPLHEDVPGNSGQAGIASHAACPQPNLEFSAAYPCNPPAHLSPPRGRGRVWRRRLHAVSHDC